MSPAQRSGRDFDLYLAVAVGGVIGASARHAVDLVFPIASNTWPTATFIINLTGAFILGVVLEAALAFAPDPTVSTFARRLRPFLITGVLGGYTTFSTYMVEAHGLVIAERAPLALLYIFGSLVGGVFLVMCGMAAGRAIFAGRRGTPEGVTPKGSDADDAELRLTEDEA